MATIMEQSPPMPWGESVPPAVHVHFSRWMLTLLAALLIGPWLVVGWLLISSRLAHTAQVPEPPESRASTESPASSESTDAEKEHWLKGKDGPWGTLAYRPIRIELPDEFVFVPGPTQPPVLWLFKEKTKPQAVEILRKSGLTQAQLDALEKSGWKSEPNGVAIEPGDEMILALTPEVRSKIYAVLVEIPENSRFIDPIWFRPGQVDERLKESGLAGPSLALIKKLLYAQGKDLLLFADFEPAVRQLTDKHEQHEFMQALSRKKTLLARLKIDANTDMNKVIHYWSVGGRSKDVAPLLNSMRREGEGELSILCLLPRFMRERLYNHPFTTNDPAAVKQDCFWSAMNAFCDQPDDRFNDMAYVGQVLKQEYYDILEPSQLGDLVFLATKDQTVIHAAVYVADDLVFTKNGASYTQPWILMHMQDMVDTYGVRYPISGPLKPLYFRRKGS